MAGPAWALDAEVTANTSAQAYALRSPFGEPLLFRQRVTQTLGLEVFHLLPDERPGGPEVFVKLRLRFDNDFGVQGSETSFNRSDALSRYVPGLGSAPLDLMYGYVEGRRLAGGWLGFRAGRQYVVDPLGWWSFDGGLVRAGAPWLFAELYGGFEQRGGLPLSLGRYERDGVWRGDRAELAGQPDVFPSYLEAASAPAWGAALEGGPGAWLHARATYRKVWNRGAAVTRPFALADGTFASVDEARTSSERAGVALDATWAERGAVRAGLAYDLYNALVASHFASLDAYLGPKATATLEYDYYRPTFDGDSIWNWFTHSPVSTLDARAALTPLPALDLAATAGARRWASDGGGEGSAPALVDAVVSADARARLGAYGLGARAVGEWGERGRREGLDLFGQRDLEGGKYFVLARTSLYEWDDALRPERSATSVGYVLGGGWRPAAYADARVEWEHNANRLVGQRYRIVALLNLWVTK